VQLLVESVPLHNPKVKHVERIHNLWGPPQAGGCVARRAHCEINHVAEAAFTFLLMRSDNEKLKVRLDLVPAAEPELAA
jgi:hypothetical protein